MKNRKLCIENITYSEKHLGQVIAYLASRYYVTIEQRGGKYSVGLIDTKGHCVALGHEPGLWGAVCEAGEKVAT